MAAIFDQLGVDHTFFIQLIVFAICFAFLSQFFFKPFLKLIQLRQKCTIEDREAAVQLAQQAEVKLAEYSTKIAAEKHAARREYDAILDQAKKEEAEILARAREEAKKITHAAAESLNQQRTEITRRLETEVESLARMVSERLVSKQ